MDTLHKNSLPAKDSGAEIQQLTKAFRVCVFSTVKSFEKACHVSLAVLELVQIAGWKRGRKLQKNQGKMRNVVENGRKETGE